MLRRGLRGLRSLLGVSMVTLVLTAHPVSGSGQGPPQPNIVVILVDDLGWGDLGCYGNSDVLTPRIDQLAQEGTLFTHFYVAGPICAPSRAGLMTGLFPARIRFHKNPHWVKALNDLWANAHGLDPSVPNITSVLHESGYTTGFFGKWGMGGRCCTSPTLDDYAIDDHLTTNSNGPTFPQVNDADFWAESTTYIVDEALEFIEQSIGQPFFVQVSTMLPHTELSPTAAQLAVYADQGPMNAPFFGANQVYYASVTAMDTEIGRLVDQIDQWGLANDTLIIFASDNGPECIFLRTSSHSGIGSPGPFRGKKRSLYEGGIRVPLIVRWPGQVPAGVVDNTSVVAAVDFLPTFAALAGSPYVAASIEPREVVGFELSATYRLYVPPLPPDGEDISDVLMGTPRPRNTPLFWEYRFDQTDLRTIDRSPRVAVRDGNWKLLLNPDGSRVELFDVVADPGESLEVSGLNPEIVATMTTMAMDWLAELPPGPVAGQAGKAHYPWP